MKNREIKFRAWCEGTHEGLTFSVPKMEYGITLSEKGNYCDVESGWDIHGEYPTIPIMQFTGLKDKNGKEIYEGDIISSRPKESVWNLLTCKIVFNEVTAKFEAQQYWENKDLFLSLSNNHDYYEYEIIGNIYENPNLLENGNNP